MNQQIGTQEAAGILGVSVRRVRALIDTGKLPAAKVGRDWIVERSALELESVRVRTSGYPAGKSRKKETK